ncbi:hypothetical protein [Algoriphagus faecimaris]|uniref:hypothetical protein n=1 Tax=Algoriphagus faecimaris TaxID=686796 RepID=UPI000B450764|nr:hypothetical protein [Algoriphagus faecimaris]
MKKFILSAGIIALAFAPLLLSAQSGFETPGYKAEPKTCANSGIETHRCIPNSLTSCDVAGQIPC